MWTIIISVVLLALAAVSAWYGVLYLGYLSYTGDAKVEQIKSNYTERQLVWFGRAVKAAVILALAGWAAYMWHSIGGGWGW